MFHATLSCIWLITTPIICTHYQHLAWHYRSHYGWCALCHYTLGSIMFNLPGTLQGPDHETIKEWTRLPCDHACKTRANQINFWHRKLAGKGPILRTLENDLIPQWKYANGIFSKASFWRWSPFLLFREREIQFPQKLCAWLIRLRDLVFYSLGMHVHKSQQDPKNQWYFIASDILHHVHPAATIISLWMYQLVLQFL